MSPFEIALGGAAALSSASGLISGNKANRQQNRMLREQRQLIDQMNQRYEQYYAPQEAYLAGELAKGPDLEGAAASARADFNQVYGLQQDAALREMQRYGINPGSQRYAAATEDNAFNQAAGSSLAANTARQQESDADWAKRVSWVQQGQGLQTNAINGYAGLGAQYGIQAATHLQDAGAGLGVLGSLYGDYRRGQTPGIAQAVQPGQTFSPIAAPPNSMATYLTDAGLRR